MARVLLIEPDTILARTYKLALERAGHEVTLSQGAQTAVHVAEKFNPEIVVLELQLAAHNGVEFLHEFRSYADWTTIPVILLSMVPPEALGLDSTVMASLGIIAQLYKPQTKLQKLVSTVNKAFEKVS